MQWDRFLQVIDALNRRRVDYIVVGAVALGLHGHPRGTRDLDLFVRPEHANIERLRLALADVWTDPSIAEITADDLCGDYPAIAGHCETARPSRRRLATAEVWLEGGRVMAIKKYRSVSEIGDTGSIDPHSPKLGQIIADVWAFNDRLAPLRPVRGVRRLRSIEELNQHRAAWRTGERNSGQR